jgi:hypothetical protein
LRYNRIGAFRFDDVDDMVFEETKRSDSER